MRSHLSIRSKVVKIFGICLCTVVLLSTNYSQTEWIQVISQEGRFAVIMPARPSKLELPFTLGEFRGVAHTTYTTFERVRFSVSYSDLAIDPDDPVVADKILDDARQSALDNSKGKVANEEKINLGSNPGRQLIIDLGSEVVISKTYLVKNRLYQLAVTIPQSPGKPVQSATFFNSFSVGDEPGKGRPADGKKVVPPPSASPCSSTGGPPPKYVRMSEGVIRMKAISLVTPRYPVEARESRVEGKVEIDIVIDEQGNVEQATARSGDQLLRDACINAAKASKFKPTLLCGTPLKVEGTLTYNFVLN